MASVLTDAPTAYDAPIAQPPGPAPTANALLRLRSGGRLTGTPSAEQLAALRAGGVPWKEVARQAGISHVRLVEILAGARYWCTYARGPR